MADSTSYSTALSSLGSAWKWRQCLALLETMEETWPIRRSQTTQTIVELGDPCLP